VCWCGNFLGLPGLRVYDGGKISRHHLHPDDSKFRRIHRECPAVGVPPQISKAIGGWIFEVPLDDCDDVEMMLSLPTAQLTITLFVSTRRVTTSSLKGEAYRN
jgi:hypothetical protein